MSKRVGSAVNRSQKASRYGALAERAAFKKYDLTPDRSSWNDGRDDDNDPWDVKAVMVTRQAPRFRLWKRQHSRLCQEGGGYVFVAYAPVGRGIQVRRTRSVRAQSLRVSFGPAGAHPKGPQAKVPVSRVFG